MLQRIFVTFLVCTLVFGHTPVRAVGVTALGVVTRATRANVAHADVSTGATVLDGDLLTTASDGLLRVRVGAAQFYLASQSSLNLQSAPGGAVARLASGTVVFSSAKVEAMDVEVAQAHIRPSGDQPTVAQISVVGAKAIDVRAQRGTVQFSYRGQTQLVQEGTANRFVLDPSAEELPLSNAANALPGKTRGDSRENKAFLYFIIGGIAFVTYLAVDEALESPSKP